MAFKPGNNANPKGRPKGAVNKVTQSVRDAFKAAFDELQEVPGARLGDWARDNPTEFYRLSGKLIPAQVQHEGEMVVTVLTGVPEQGGDLV
jgi:hypothetical protein